MATSSFEKDFIVTDKQAPLWEKALEHFENKKIEWKPVPSKKLTGEELSKFLESIKA